MSTYKVTPEVFRTDVKHLYSTIRPYTEKNDWLYQSLIINVDHGLDVYQELKEYVEISNDVINVSSSKPRIKRKTFPQIITIIIDVLDEDEKLFDILKILDQKASRTEPDVYILALYDRMLVNSPRYVTPTFFGKGFPNSDRIEWEK